MTERRKAWWVNTLSVVLPLILTMIGIAVASEHRITVVEQGIGELRAQTLILAQNQKMVMETLAKTTAIMDMMCKRHEIEDTKKAK